MIRELAQPARLERALPRWRQRPIYRDRLQGIELFAGFGGLPFITKRDLREGFPENFFGSNASLEALTAGNRVEIEYTSGTSDERLPVVFGKSWWNEQEERALRLNSVVARVLDEHPDARRATLTTPACNGQTCPTVWMSRTHRTFGNSLFVNLARIPFLLTDADLARMAEEIAAWSPQFLDVDPVHGVRFALYCEQHGIRFPSLRFVLGSYEFVSVVHRRILERVFGVPLFNLYGSTETGHLLMENERGEMKASLDTALLEIVEPDSRGVGDLIVTTLSNDYMPLLRYRIGDLAERREQSYVTDYIVHGRSRDALHAADGQRITTWQVDQCFAGVGGMAHYQLQQLDAGGFQLRYLVDGDGPSADELSGVVARLESLLQTSVPVAAEAVDVLVPSASGKFRLTCRVSS